MTYLHFLKCSLSIFSFCCSSLYALSLWDESSFALGLTNAHFRERALANSSPSSQEFVAQHYRCVGPAIRASFDKYFSSQWSLRWTLDCTYDSGSESENTLSNGRYTFDAHSWNAEFRLLPLFQTDASKKIKIGLGVGVGNFGLVTYVSNNSEYMHYSHLIAPIFHIEQNYTLLALPAKWSVQISGVDFYYFSGWSYTIDNAIIFKSTEEFEQSLHFQFNYWDLHLGKKRNRDWLSDYHALSCLFEVTFK
jgi:hypothetical protein